MPTEFNTDTVVAHESCSVVSVEQVPQCLLEWDSSFASFCYVTLQSLGGKALPNGRVLRSPALACRDRSPLCNYHQLCITRPAKGPAWEGVCIQRCKRAQAVCLRMRPLSSAWNCIQLTY